MKNRKITLASAAVVALIGLSVFFVSTKGMGEWKYSQIADPMTDKVRAEAVLSSDDDVGVVAVTCKEGDKIPSVFFSTGRRLTGIGDEEVIDRMVYFRFDDGLVQETVGTIVNDMIGFNPEAGEARWDAKIIAGLRESKKLAIRTVDVQNGDVSMVFDVRGATNAIDSVLEACKP